MVLESMECCKKGQLPQIAAKLEPWSEQNYGVNCRGEPLPQVPGACYADKGEDKFSSGGDGGASALPAPAAAKRMALAARDKESLLEEILDLKRELSDQAYHFKLHKVHAATVQLENRKLERDIEELEIQGNTDGPRTGGRLRLRAKLQGLKARLLELQSTCDAQQDELVVLRRDFRISRIHEVEVERDVFAGEIGRLQKVLRRLRALHASTCTENKELGRMREKLFRLECANQRLGHCISVVHQTLNRSNKEVKVSRCKAGEASLEAKKYAKKVKDLGEHSELLEGLLERERIEKRRMEKRILQLQEEIEALKERWESATFKDLLASAAARLRRQKEDQLCIEYKQSTSLSLSSDTELLGDAQSFARDVDIKESRESIKCIVTPSELVESVTPSSASFPSPSHEQNDLLTYAQSPLNFCHPVHKYVHL